MSAGGIGFGGVVDSRISPPGSSVLQSIGRGGLVDEEGSFVHGAIGGFEAEGFGNLVVGVEEEETDEGEVGCRGCRRGFVAEGGDLDAGLLKSSYWEARASISWA